MPLLFITGSESKYQEVKALLPHIERVGLDLPEIQEIDPKIIIETKLQEALKYKSGEFIVEDTSLYLDCLNGLPGPLIKWFMKTIGNEGLFTLVSKFGNYKAEARTIIGYLKNENEVRFFEGVVKGEIVSPEGGQGFGWDPIFQPDGFNNTFAQMGQEEKNEISMRKNAATKLKKFLEGQKN